MSNENLFFLKVDLSDNDIEYLGQITRKIQESTNVGYYDHDFHLTIEETLYCPRKSIRTNLDAWLGMNSQFRFTLNSVNSFPSQRGGIIYLTSDSSEEKDRISDFHYGIHELIKSADPNRQNNYRYIPHVTLLKDIPLDKVGHLVETFSQEIKPFVINISEITLRETKLDGQQIITKHQLSSC